MSAVRKLPPPRTVDLVPVAPVRPGNEPMVERELGPLFDELTRCREAEEAASRAADEADRRREEIEEEWHRVYDACEEDASAALAKARHESLSDEEE